MSDTQEHKSACPPMTAERARAILEVKGVHADMVRAMYHEFGKPGDIVDALGRSWPVVPGYTRLKRLNPETGDAVDVSACASHVADAAIKAAARFLALGL